MQCLFVGVKLSALQFSETNVMHFLFSLLRIKGLYMFPSLTCSSLGGVTQTALGILRACYVSWLNQNWSEIGAAN
jgi:hypothetical protein